MSMSVCAFVCVCASTDVVLGCHQFVLIHKENVPDLLEM